MGRVFHWTALKTVQNGAKYLLNPVNKDEAGMCSPDNSVFQMI